MNKKIEDCLYQAGLTASGCWDELGTYEQEAIEKFAELIVKECTNVCLSQRDPANLNYKPSERFAEAIKQHFGVKE